MAWIPSKGHVESVALCLLLPLVVALGSQPIKEGFPSPSSSASMRNTPADRNLTDASYTLVKQEAEISPQFPAFFGVASWSHESRRLLFHTTHLRGLKQGYCDYVQGGTVCQANLSPSCCNSSSQGSSCYGCNPSNGCYQCSTQYPYVACCQYNVPAPPAPQRCCTELCSSSGGVCSSGHYGDNWNSCCCNDVVSQPGGYSSCPGSGRSLTNMCNKNC